MVAIQKQFAPEYERDEHGWVKFPRDIQYRKKLFPEGVFIHPARNQLYLLEEIAKYVSEPGETILDPFGGTGGILVATKLGRKVVMIEIEGLYLGLINEGIEMFGAQEMAKVIQGDCRQVLPLPCDHAIFSPPYANVVHDKTGFEDLNKKYATFMGKSTSGLNMGRLSEFVFHEAMEKVYQKLWLSVRPGGTVTVITRDHKGPNDSRVLMGGDTVRQATKAGFNLRDWFKWVLPGTKTSNIMRAKGATVISDEDCIIFVKPE